MVQCLEMHIKINHGFGEGFSAKERRLAWMAGGASDRVRAYQEAAAEEAGAKIPVSIRDEQTRALDAIVHASNAEWPDWLKWTGMVKTSGWKVQNAMQEEARKRIQAKCPELHAGWFRWLTSPATRKAYWIAEGQMMQAIAEESKAKLEEQDSELNLIQQRYSKNSKKFAEGGVKLSLKNTPKRSKLLKSIEKASRITDKAYASYKEFPPEVKSALQDEETLVEDLVTRYGIIDPSEIDRLFTDNQNGGNKLLTRIDAYFNGAEYNTKGEPGAHTLREMAATGRRSEITKIAEQFKKAIKGLKYSVFGNRNVWYYRSLLELKNPNASPDTKRKALQEGKNGKRLEFTVPPAGKVIAFTKCKDGDYFRLTDASGNTYILDIGPEGGSDTDRRKVTLVMPPKRGGKDPQEIDLPWQNVTVSYR